MAMSGVEIEMSGEVAVAFVGTLVGVFVLRAMEEDCVIWSEISEPRESDKEEVVMGIEITQDEGCGSGLEKIGNVWFE